jgi:hypothetical protein
MNLKLNDAFASKARPLLKTQHKPMIYKRTITPQKRPQSHSANSREFAKIIRYIKRLSAR